MFFSLIAQTNFTFKHDQLLAKKMTGVNSSPVDVCAGCTLISEQLTDTSKKANESHREQTLLEKNSKT